MLDVDVVQRTEPLVNVFATKPEISPSGTAISPYDHLCSAIPPHIEQFVPKLDHTVTHPFDSFRSELMHYHPTEAVVIWWVY
jgi:hypothetical protein